MEGGTGITIKLWKMSLTEGEEEESYKTKDSALFIFPNQSSSALHQIKQLIQTLSSVKDLFPDSFLNLIEQNSAEVKGEGEVLVDGGGGESMKLENNEEDDDEPYDNSVKLEPDNLDNFIDDSELWEEEELDEEEYYQREPKRRKSGLKRKKKMSIPRVCNKCEKSFVWKKNYFQHLTDCNPDQLQDEFGENLEEMEEELRSGTIKNDYVRKTPKGPFHCEKCPQMFHKYHGFKSHLKAHELSASLKKIAKSEAEAEESSDVKPTLGMQLKDLRDGVHMKCEKCDLAYSNFQLYKNHMDQFHKKSLGCLDCGLKFTLENTLVKHRLDYHTLYPKTCDQCQKLCMTAKDLYEHLQSHSQTFMGKTSPCEICGKLLKNKYSLKAHVEAVHEKKKGGEFACDMCGKILKSKASLDYHKRSVHTQEYPFRCEICGKGYIKYNRMVNCINNHQGIYKYRCPECDYKTNKLLQFKEHVNSHTGEKAYFCPVCHHQSNGTKNLGCHTKQVHKLTLCQAEVAYKTTRFGLPMTDDQIEEMKSRMSSLSSYDQKIMKDLRLNKKNEGTAPAEHFRPPAAPTAIKSEVDRLNTSGSREDAAEDYRIKERVVAVVPMHVERTIVPMHVERSVAHVADRDMILERGAARDAAEMPREMTEREKALMMQQAYLHNSIIL